MVCPAPASAAELRLAVTADAVRRVLTVSSLDRLLERRADLPGQPRLVDYPAEIKKWQVLADQARQAAERWEQQPP